MLSKVLDFSQKEGYKGDERFGSPLLFYEDKLMDVTRTHELDLDVSSIEMLRAVGHIWIFLPYSERVQINDVVIVYAGARTGEFLHPSVFATTVVEVDQSIVSARTASAPLHDRVRISFGKPLAAIAL